MCIVDECETLYKLLNDLTNLQFIYVENEGSYIYFMNIIWGLNQIIFIEFSLLYGKY